MCLPVLAFTTLLSLTVFAALAATSLSDEQTEDYAERVKIALER